MPENVLHILGTAQPEGSSMVRIVRALAANLDPKRYRIQVLFLQGNGPLVKTLQDSGVEANSLEWWRGFRDPVGAWRFWKLLRRKPYSIVQIHFGGRSIVKLARSATGARIVRHVHGRILEPQGLAPVSFSAHGTDAVIAVSRAVADCVVDGKPHVIYSGLEIAEDWATPTEAPRKELVIGTAGRLIELKGIAYLIRAMAAIKDSYPHLQLEIAGSGPYRRNLESEVVAAGLQNRVRFLGWIDDISTALSRWDIFVLPSLEEGFPIAALDAMGAGLPVITSSVGGVPELIEHEKSGFLVPPRDADALAERLGFLLANPDVRQSIGAAAFARVRDHFTARAMAEKIKHLYDQLLTDAR